jgi:pilus assembly protein CpaB
MRPKSIILLGLALGCGLVASIGINQVMANRREAPSTQPVDGVDVLVALTDVGLGDPITPEVLKIEKWPAGKVPNGAIGELKETEGRRARSKIFAGEPILEVKLLGKGESAASATDMIPTGYRAVPIAVDAVSGSSGMILPGDRVDLLVHIAADMNRGIQRAITRTFLQNVKIFAVDDDFHRSNDGTALAAKTISVLVNLEQAELIMLAAQLGKIQLVMRSATDDVDEETAGADVQKLLKGHFDTVPSSPGKPDGLISLLNQNGAPQVEKAAPPATSAVASEPAPAPNVFTMVVINGSETREYQFTDGQVLPEAEPRPEAGTKNPPSADGSPPDDSSDTPQAESEEPSAPDDN